MTKEYTQLRIWVKTLRKLRRVYAETGESMIAIVDRLAEQECKRLTGVDCGERQTVNSEFRSIDK